MRTRLVHALHTVEQYEDDKVNLSSSSSSSSVSYSSLTFIFVYLFFVVLTVKTRAVCYYVALLRCLLISLHMLYSTHFWTVIIFSVSFYFIWKLKNWFTIYIRAEKLNVIESCLHAVFASPLLWDHLLSSIPSLPVTFLNVFYVLSPEVKSQDFGVVFLSQRVGL